MSFDLQYGTWVHEFLESWYTNPSTAPTKVRCEIPEDVRLLGDQERDLEWYQSMVQVQMNRYVDHYRYDSKLFDIHMNERELEIDYRGVRLGMKLDLLIEFKGAKGLWVMDHKTASRLNRSLVDTWEQRFQFLFYCWFMKKFDPSLSIRGYYPNAIKKSELHERVNEPTAAYMSRLNEDMATRPEAYFYRERFELTPSRLIRFEKRVLNPKIDRVLAIQSMSHKDPLFAILAKDMNCDYCTAYFKQCEFIPLCHEPGKGAMGMYERKPTKHSELPKLST